MPPRSTSRSKNGRSKLFQGAAKDTASPESSSKPSLVVKNGVSVVNAKPPIPSQTILKTLKEVGLEYDVSAGVISGDSVYVSGLQSLSLSALQNMRSYIKSLRKQLRAVSSTDATAALEVKKVMLEKHGVNGFTPQDLDLIDELGKSYTDYGISDKQKEEISKIMSEGPKTDEDVGREEEIAEDAQLTGVQPRRLSVSRKRKFEEVSGDEQETKKENQESLDVIESDVNGSEPPNIAAARGVVVTDAKSTQVLEATKKLGLFVPNEELAKKKDISYLKQWYGVSSFPTDYLQDYISGPVPDIDFNAQNEVKKGQPKDAKPAQKANFNNFLASVDHYFRAFDDEDLVFLKKKYVYSPSLHAYYANQFNTGKSRKTGRSPLIASTSLDSKGVAVTTGERRELVYNPRVHPYIVPKLGKLYTKVWAEEDGNPKAASIGENNGEQVVPKGSEEAITDDVLETDQVSCGPLVSRLLQALIPSEEGEGGIDEDLEEEKKSESEVTNGNSSVNDTTDSVFFSEEGRNSMVRFDYETLEQRLERELKYVGVHLNYKNEASKQKTDFNEDGPEEDVVNNSFEETWLTNRQDDEISRELRALQSQLKVVNLKNNLRKQVLFKKVYEEMSFREFYNILENLNKQIDQYYLKKQKVLVKSNKKGKKIGEPDSGSLSHQQVLDKTLKSLIEKRAKWIEEIGPLFDYKSNLQIRKLPEENIFNKKIALIDSDNLQEFQEVYNELVGVDESEEDEEEEEEETEVENDYSVMLTEGVRIKKDELKLGGGLEIDKRLNGVLVDGSLQ